MVNSIKIGIAAVAFVTAALTVNDETVPQVETTRKSITFSGKNPPCLEVYYRIKEYADSFDIPLRYAFGIAYAETRYEGPFQWKYNPAQTSCVGAVGPMQVMPSTARWINKDQVSSEYLRTNIRYNVYTSMKLLRKLYNLRGDWKLVFGEYNTGRPCVNDYANRVYHHQINWK
jgi:soluble lytic murein transglycosylase-like protein